jgi:Protein of unknown function (DUF3102)
MTEEVKGLSYVPQIYEAYDALIASHKTGLGHALRLGELLNEAKEVVGHGKWTDWLKVHCSRVTHRTANLYMNLAKNKDKFSDPTNSQRVANMAAEDDLSIRAAIDVVNAANGVVKNRTPTKRTKTTTTPAAVEPPEPVASVDLATLMKSSAADEIKTAMKQAEVYDEVMTAPLADQIRATPPSVLVTALMEAYDPERLQNLVKDLINRLKPKASAQAA